MRYFALSLLVHAVLGAPTGEPSAAAAPSDLNATNKIHVVWNHHKGSSQKSLVALTEDGSGILGQSCSDSLSYGRFADHTIGLDVDADGGGKLTYGNTTYKVLMKAEHSGGITCSRIYGSDHASVDCVVPWSGSTDSPSPLSTAQDCFTNVAPEKRHVDVLPSFGHRVGYETSNHSLKARISPSDPSCQPSGDTILVGDGDPHQNYFHQQLSENIFCGAAESCSTAYQETQSFTVQFTLGIGKQITEWITGGFAVSEQWTTGNSYTCKGGSGDTVCTWYNTAHTAYTVLNRDFDCNGAATLSDPFILYSPNADSRGSGFYCVIGPCRAPGDSYWDYNGRAGGP